MLAVVCTSYADDGIWEFENEDDARKASEIIIGDDLYK